MLSTDWIEVYLYMLYMTQQDCNVEDPEAEFMEIESFSVQKLEMANTSRVTFRVAVSHCAISCLLSVSILLPNLLPSHDVQATTD